jgi:hypothetical protein
MASHENREPLIWAACVLGLAALFVLIGVVTPKRAADAAPRHEATPSSSGES